VFSGYLAGIEDYRVLSRSKSHTQTVRRVNLKMKILVTEDSAVYRHLLCTRLAEWNFSVEAVADAESALAIVSVTTTPLLLLVDWELPGMSGLELVAKVRSLDLPHYVYAVIVTSRDDKADVALALNAGADDYISKPFHDQELRARVEVASRTLAIHEKLVLANEQLKTLASRDPLTELLNRRAFMNEFRRETLRARRTKSPLTLVMCDIDHFKEVNDRFGHTTGDDVLRIISRELRDASRGTDLVGRMGGDEFLLVLSGSNAEGGQVLISRVREHLQKRAELKEVPIELSFGVIEMNLEDSERFAIEKVDAAMYSAKRQRPVQKRVGRFEFSEAWSAEPSARTTAKPRTPRLA
jgi:diguanylate cyclase (GGDEF)-like protein